MDNRVIFSAVEDRLSQLCDNENVKLPSYEFLHNLLKFLSRACSYEEEGRKIRPNVVIGYNISSALDEVPSTVMIPSKKGKSDGTDLEKIIKTLVPFCNNGWYLYIDVANIESVEYGVLRAFSGPMGLSLLDVLFTDDDEEGDKEYGIVELTVLSNYEIKLTGISGNDLTIDFRLTTHGGMDLPLNYTDLAEDITCGYGYDDKEVLHKVFMNLLSLIKQRVHGTICLVVKEEFQPNEILKDGIWLDNPIELAKFALNAVRDVKDINSGEIYYGLSGLFLEMLNLDGITVVDNLGRILAYNVFVKQSGTNELNVTGGARKRAAHTILHSEERDILGIYFQSQDGNAFYERMTANEQ